MSRHYEAATPDDGTTLLADHSSSRVSWLR